MRTVGHWAGRKRLTYYLVAKAPFSPPHFPSFAFPLQIIQAVFSAATTKTLFVVGTILILVVNPMKGWDISGHMFVAQITYERLSPTTQAQLSKLSDELQLRWQPLNELNVAAWANDNQGERFCRGRGRR